MNQHKKSKNQLLVELFMARCHAHPKGVAMQGLPTLPTIPGKRVRALRAKLILEEALETIRAMGVAVDACDFTGNSKTSLTSADVLEFRASGPSDMIEVADGLADLEVVLLGTAAAYGVAQQPIFELVSVNNLLKFAPGYGFDRDGKLIKPLNHEAPTLAIRRELTLQGWDGK